MSIISFFKCGSQRYESILLNDTAKLDFELGLKDPHEGCNAITNSFLKVIIMLHWKRKQLQPMHLLRTNNFEKLFKLELD